MSERSQAAREGKQEDILEQIISQGLDKINSPAQAAAGVKAPGPEAPPAPDPEGGAAIPPRRAERTGGPPSTSIC